MQQSFAGKLFNTISWTLLHSVWQGLLLTIIVAAILFATKKSAPAFRYSLLTALLFCFIGTVTITFIFQWQQSSGIATAFTHIITTRNVFAAQNNWWHTITDFMNHYSTWMMAVWAAVVLMKGVRMLVDLYYVNRLRRSGISYPDESWIIHVQQLSHKMGIRKKVMLFESQLVSIPMVAGHFKPVILLPLGMLMQLSVAEVEAVLLHELAHIRRHDYMINLLQRITGILFFFNPAVLWLSSLIRSERENCCDDMAITHTNNKLKFVEALISVKQHAMSAAPIAMNFLGQKNLLLHRVNRIVHNRNKSLDMAELSFVTLSIIAAALYFSNVKITLPPPAQHSLVVKHILPATQVSASIDDKGQQEIFTTAKRGSGGPVVMTNAFEDRPVTKKMTKGAETIATKDIIQPANPSPAMEAEKSMIVTNDDEAYRSPAEQDLLQAEKDRLQAALDRKQAERDRAQAELDRKQADKDRLQADKDRAQADKDRAQAALDRKQAEKDRAQAMLEAGVAANRDGVVENLIR
jgi:beta-lactamase regulating signal transducer with metallopeptidase domain